MNKPNKEIMSINRVGISTVAGGVNTDWDKAQLPLGAYSVAENVRVNGPGFKLRPGLTPHHSSDFDKVMSLYSYGKEKFFAQTVLGDVYEATDLPPGVTSGAFGTIVVDRSDLDTNNSGQDLPGSWSDYREHVLFSEGSLQHLVYPGVSAKPLRVIFKASTTIPRRLLSGGQDITDDVIDPESNKTSDTLTFTVANADALYVCTEFPASSFTFDIQTIPGGTKTMTFQFHDGDNWDTQTTGIIDLTGAWAQDGVFTASMAGRATDGNERPTVNFGTSGYWYRFKLGSSTASPTVSFNSITYEGDFRPIENVMDQTPAFIVEAQVETASGEYEIYAGGSISVGALAAGDYVYFSSENKVWAVYAEVGATPNTTASTAINGLDTWTGAGWGALTNVEDDSNGLANAGYFSFDRTSQSPQPTSFNNGLSHMYWYRVKFDKAIVAGVILSLQVLNFFDIEKFGQGGKVSATWKDRGCFTFSKFGRDIYVSKKYRLNILNGSDYAILTPGDGRHHDVTAMVSFHNELMVFQEEKGKIGGCLTLFEGYSPETFGKLVLSTRLGTFSAQSVCVIDGSTQTTRTNDVTQTQVAFISKYGVFITDGRTIQPIHGPIGNLFDPEEDLYIDTTFDSGDCPHWIAFDSAGNCLRLGIRTQSATTVSPDIFPVFHLDINEWTFDTYDGYEITAFSEVTAASGTVDSLQYCAVVGETSDLIYRCDAGKDCDTSPDVATSASHYDNVDMYATFSEGTWDAVNQEWDAVDSGFGFWVSNLTPQGGWNIDFYPDSVDITIDNFVSGSQSCQILVQFADFTDITLTGVTLTNGVPYTMDLSSGTDYVTRIAVTEMTGGKVFSITNLEWASLTAGADEAIIGTLQMEFSNGANYLEIKEILLRSSSNADYELTKNVYENGVVDSGEAETFTMESADTNGLTYRERILESIQLNHHFSLNLSWKNAEDPPTPGKSITLYDLLYEINSTPNLD